MTSVFADYEISVRDLSQRLIAAINALPVKTAETMAKATYAVLCEAAKETGQSPKSEVMIRAPGESRHFDDKTCWVVAWESGPYEWAVSASLGIGVACGKLVEPYYSFDLCFYPGEDRQ